METFKIENLSFKYPSAEKAALCGVDLSIKKGEFLTVCGKSGCGKTTLLRLLKPEMSPYGETEGRVLFEGYSFKEGENYSAKIGFVMQDPENQIVTDKVWHELAFGLENIGVPNGEIRTRVAEMASYFGINKWFHKKVTELSGGQKQLLNLAAVMVMNPSVLILDEPTSRLDPAYAEEFINTLAKINRELGTTVIIAEHRLEEIFEVSDRIVVMENGKVAGAGTPRELAGLLNGNEMYGALPQFVRVYNEVQFEGVCPVSVREARVQLEEYAKEHSLVSLPEEEVKYGGEVAVEVKNVWFRYERNSEDILKDMSISAFKGEIFALLGGNGAGKTTALNLICGANKAYRGKTLIFGEKITPDMYGEIIGVLPQNPQSLFVKKTVYEDLESAAEGNNERLKTVMELCGLTKLADSHPYDLSGGEQQRAALAKVLLKTPQVLLLDEPTKGMDAGFKKVFAEILLKLKEKNVCIIMVSHDIEFCAQYADKCAMLFDGNITAVLSPREFFSANSFYTTAANRMSKGIVDKAILAEDIIYACTGIKKEEETKDFPENFFFPKDREKKKQAEKKANIRMTVCGIIMAIFVLLQIADIKGNAAIAVTALFGVVMMILLPKGGGENYHFKAGRRKTLSGKSRLMISAALLLMPITIAAGIVFFDDRKYFLISVLILIETLFLFFALFESRKPGARELVLISVLCGIAVAGRAAFFMLPHFKPLAAVIIICGCLLGGETGFLIGAVSAFVSNFFYRQGPWTPWQMLTFGLLGLAAGIFIRLGLIRKNKTDICIFGFFAVVLIYGGIMNPASVIMSMNGEEINIGMIMSAYVTGFPLDLVHAGSTAVFLWFITDEFAEKLDRIKLKYGMTELG
ncbi:MAG: ATP-binding cassette domain-containing protein [Ruminococcaceae bacterium]|nr:ATP-binding cassette domain-containing protein [Oscillospiraceae bacterium]